MNNRPTPETDACISAMRGESIFDLCKRLERERDEAREQANVMHEQWLSKGRCCGNLAEELHEVKQQRDEAREENKKSRKALEWIAERYDDSKPMHQVAMDAYEMSCTARAALRKEETK